jgi:hypothetical protein
MDFVAQVMFVEKYLIFKLGHIAAPAMPTCYLQAGNFLIQ